VVWGQVRAPAAVCGKRKVAEVLGMAVVRQGVEAVGLGDPQ
jgi:hypothetical protein